MISRAIGIAVISSFLVGGLATSVMMGACGCCVRMEIPSTLSSAAVPGTASGDDRACCNRGEQQANGSEFPAPSENERDGMLCGSQCGCTVVAVMFETPLPRSPGMMGTIDTLADSLPDLAAPPSSPPPRAIS